jgi:hypothetical protein
MALTVRNVGDVTVIVTCGRALFSAHLPPGGAVEIVRALPPLPATPAPAPRPAPAASLAHPPSCPPDMPWPPHMVPPAYSADTRGAAGAFSART